MSDQSNPVNEPKGHLLTRTLAMPKDCNSMGDIFGGWIMSQLDLAGGILAKEVSGGRIVTVSVSKIDFKNPVKVGDVVCCYGECAKIGRTSITLDLDLWVRPVNEEGIGKPFSGLSVKPLLFMSPLTATVVRAPFTLKAKSSNQPITNQTLN